MKIMTQDGAIIHSDKMLVTINGEEHRLEFSSRETRSSDGTGTIEVVFKGKDVMSLEKLRKR